MSWVWATCCRCLRLMAKAFDAEFIALSVPACVFLQLPAAIAQRRLVRADLRYTNGFALTWAKAEPPTLNHGSNT